MKLTYALAISALFAATAATRAQTTPPPRSFGDGGLPEFLQPYDVNGDGVLSAEERDAARAARPTRENNALSQWDTNHDGVLSQAELDAARQATQTHIDALRGQRFDEADTNHDGFLDLAEFTAMCAHANLPADLVNRIFTQIAGADNLISRAEFLRSCEPPPPPPQLPPFATADADSSGDVSLAEFTTALAALTPPVDAQHATDLFHRLDGNHDGKLVPGEYPGTRPLPPPALPAFAVADANSDGFVSHDEFLAVATAAGYAPLAAEGRFLEADRNHDRRLDLIEYFSLLPPPVLPAFATADANNDGFVGPVEFRIVAAAAGVPQAVADHTFQDADGNHDGKLDLVEYFHLLPQPPLPPFDVADSDHDGFVSKAEFEAAAASVGIPLAVADDMFLHLDTPGQMGPGGHMTPPDGKLSPQEYAQHPCQERQ